MSSDAVSKISVVLLLLGSCSASVIPIGGVVAAQTRYQDEVGQHAFSHVGGPNAREETKTADGVTRGSYSYVDGNGLVQTAAYVSDPTNGFRVAATNLPVGPAVPAGPAVIAASPDVIHVAPAVVPAAPTVIHAAPAVVPAAPAVIPVAPTILAASTAVLKTTHITSAPVAATLGKAEPVPGSFLLKETSPESPKPKEPAPIKEEASEEPATPAPVASSTAAPTVEPSSENPAPSNPYVPVQDTPEVVAARAQHLAAVQEVQVRDEATGTEASTEHEEPTETPETPEPTEASPSSPAPSPPALLPAAIPAVRVTGPLPAVPVAPIPPVAAVAQPAIARVAAVAAPSVSVFSAPTPPVAASSVAAVSAPVFPVSAVAPAAVLADAAQFRVQDELGQYAFGHLGGPNSREEVKTADGITRGSYAYVDGNGLVQNAAYVSDPVNGFRVAASNLPVQPSPAYIPDSPEVAKAKAEHLKAQEEHVAKL